MQDTGEQMLINEHNKINEEENEDDIVINLKASASAATTEANQL